MSLKIYEIKSKNAISWRGSAIIPEFSEILLLVYYLHWWQGSAVQWTRCGFFFATSNQYVKQSR